MPTKKSRLYIKKDNQWLSFFSVIPSTVISIHSITTGSFFRTSHQMAFPCNGLLPGPSNTRCPSYPLSASQGLKPMRHHILLPFVATSLLCIQQVVQSYTSRNNDIEQKRVFCQFPMNCNTMASVMYRLPVHAKLNLKISFRQ